MNHKEDNGPFRVAIFFLHRIILNCDFYDYIAFCGAQLPLVTAECNFSSYLNGRESEKYEL